MGVKYERRGLEEIGLDIVEWNYYLLKGGICSGKYRTLQSPVIILCTTRFDIQQFYILPTCILCASEQTAITFLRRLNWLYFITGSEYVYCAVRYESLINKRPCLGSDLSPQKPGSFLDSQCQIYGEQSGTVKVFSGLLLLSLSVSFHQSSIIVFIYMLLLPEKQMVEAWEPSEKQSSLGNRGALDRKVLPLFSSLQS